LFEGIKSPFPLTGGTGSSECELRDAKSETGRAMSTTPNKETYAAICSMRVKGSFMK
jgi:hypothetical protein